MLRLKISGATARNPDLVRSDRQEGEDNLAWLARHEPEGRGIVLLLGGSSAVSIRLRVAQCEARRDMEASWWSHVAVLDPARPGEALHIDLEPDGPVGFPPLSNAVQRSPLERFADPEAWPNIAVLGIPVPPEELSDSCSRFRSARAAVDGVELYHAWLGYLWGVTGASNPLRAGVGLPSSAFAEFVVGAAGYDLTPGLASRSSCPEAIWQSAVWWHQYPRPTALKGDAGEHATGAYTAVHFLGGARSARATSAPPQPTEPKPTEPEKPTEPTGTSASTLSKRARPVGGKPASKPRRKA